MANEATAIFLQCDVKCLDEEARALVDSGINPLTFSGLKLAVSTDESVAINFDEKPKVIISSSGMCEAGRIRHHLKTQFVAKRMFDFVCRLSGRGNARQNVV